MFAHVAKPVGVVLALVALPVLVLIGPLAVALFAAFFSSLSMPLH
jgi:hypothetical protein